MAFEQFESFVFFRSFVLVRKSLRRAKNSTVSSTDSEEEILICVHPCSSVVHSPRCFLFFAEKTGGLATETQRAQRRNKKLFCVGLCALCVSVASLPWLRLCRSACICVHPRIHPVPLAFAALQRRPAAFFLDRLWLAAIFLSIKAHEPAIPR